MAFSARGLGATVVAALALLAHCSFAAETTDFAIIDDSLQLPIDVIPCPIPACIAPPENCILEPSTELNAQGCPKFPCGVLECDCSPCPIAPPSCVVDDQINFITGCPSCAVTVSGDEAE